MSAPAPSRLPAIGCAAVATLYGILFLHAESQLAVGALLAAAAAAVALAARIGLIARVSDSIGANQTTFDMAAVIGVLAAALVLHQAHFAILMMTTAMLLMVAALGLTVQFGFAGVVNFAGAAFLGIGCYTAAVVTQYTALPSWLSLPLGGFAAAVIGSILILPVLRTRGHYAALVTIAFGILFKTFLEVNDTLGGPQGMQVKPIVVLGWNFAKPPRIGDFTASFYFSYLLLALALLAVCFVLVRRLERSWIGLSLDAIRLDEIASACYGLSRITVLGALYLAVVCLIPEILISYAAVPFYFGGTSLLIVVSVTMDTVAQIQGYLLAHQYEGLIKRSKLRGRNR